MASRTGISLKDGLSPGLRSRLAKIRDKRPILDAAGAAMTGVARRSFREPGLRPLVWDDLSPFTLAAKGGKGNVLIDSGALVQSLNWITGGSEVEVGTDRAYAEWLQWGTKGMPARPFLPLTEDGAMTADGERAVLSAMEDEIRALWEG